MGKPKINKVLLSVDSFPMKPERMICTNCCTVYRIEWLNEEDIYKELWPRYCPFCGLLTNEW
jgi:hypothetical protein